MKFAASVRGVASDEDKDVYGNKYAGLDHN